MKNFFLLWLIPFAYLATTIIHAEGNDWMSTLDGEKLISSISLPGTHDAGALKEPIKGTAQTQTATIPEQLNFGVRLLDIRCRHINNTFDIHHGIVYQELTFTEVVKQVSNFLDENPTECVVMSIQQEFVPKNNTRKFTETLDAYIAEQPNKWYLKPSVPSLEEVRGKIVLLRRYSRATLQGIDASQWPGENFSKNGLTVQDCFQVKDVKEKWQQIITAFEVTLKKTDPKIIHLNFSSGTTSGPFGLPDILTVSDFINPKMLQYFKTAPRGDYGWIMLDFATEELTQLIYQTNLHP